MGQGDLVIDEASEILYFYQNNVILIIIIFK